MATHDAFTDRLSDYLDDEDLGDAERREIASHLETCAECRATLLELRAVKQQAAALTDTAPDADLWAGVQQRLDLPPAPPVLPFRKLTPQRRFSFTLPQLVAASLALMVLSGGAVWIVRHGGSQTELYPLAAAPVVEITPANFSDPHYDEAIADLEKALESGRDKLDPETVRVLQDNLDAIDRAIDQCRRALAADPANAYLNSHLADARNRKLALLRRVSALVDAQS
ncbi:MAG TPA: zf-HC2 domain-containing protein [Vicinamibacterales bacterium]|jgi:tetratricopeptide (TPR) repeat protein|nr:zf-HC2 domain-containing protein [Vicinamibacterales bacterium]